MVEDLTALAGVSAGKLDAALVGNFRANTHHHLADVLIAIVASAGKRW